MKVERRDGTPERKILTGMIVDPVVLGAVAARWDPALFSSKWAALVGGWCVDFYRKYRKAPSRQVEDLFMQWASSNKRADETVKLVENFLEGLSGEYSRLKKGVNPEFLIDLCGTHFNKVRLKDHADLILADLESGEISKAEERAQKFNRVELGAGAGIDVLLDEEALRAAIESKREPLIEYPGALGNFFGDTLERDGFIAFEGPEKRGKTNWLLDIAWRGMQQQRKVAFFEVGDMSQNQIMRRFAARACGRPLEKTKPGEVVKFPKFLSPPLEVGGVPELDFDERVFKKDLSPDVAWKTCQRVVKKLGTDESLLRLAVYANSSVTVHGIQSTLEAWDRLGWTPDVIVIDYADLIAPVNGTADTRDQIDYTWKSLRRLSQERHCLVVTATQTDAASYKQDVINMGNFSGDKRKNAHVTGMVGINQGAGEKELGLVRLNWVVLREAAFDTRKCCWVAQCLPIANAAVKSTF